MDASHICQLCSQLFKDPRMLSCFHSFCRACLRTLMVQNEHRGEESQQDEMEGSHHDFNCPTCKKPVTIPTGGVGDLPQDLHLGVKAKIAEYQSKVACNNLTPCDVCTSSGPAVGFCCSCQHFLCQLCYDHHKRARNSCQHDVVPMGGTVSREQLSAIKPTCTLHNKEFALYCETCNCLICHDCTTTVHKDHLPNVKLPCVVAISHKDDAHMLLTKTCEIVVTLTNAVDNNVKILKEVEKNENDVFQNIIQTFLQLHQALDDKKSKLLEELSTFALSKKTALTLQKETFEKVIQDLTHCSEIASSKLETYTDCEIISLKKMLSTELQSSINEAQSVSPEPCESSDINVTLRPDLFQAYLPEVCHLVDICPKRSNWTSLDTAATKGNKYTLKVEAKDSNGNLYPYDDIKLEVVLQSEVASPQFTTPQEKCVEMLPITLQPPTIPSSTLQHPTLQPPTIPSSTLQHPALQPPTIPSSTSQHPALQPPTILFFAPPQSLPLRHAVLGNVVEHKGGTYTITLTPDQKGPHLLKVTMNGQHVARSPHKLQIHDCVPPLNWAMPVSRPINESCRVNTSSRGRR